MGFPLFRSFERARSVLLLATLCFAVAAALAACTDDGGGDTSDAGDSGAATHDAAVDDASSDDASTDAGNDADAPVEPTELASYCEQSASSYYSWLQLCYGEESYSDEGRAAYVARMRTRCLHAEQAVADGRLSYDARQATRCLDTLDSTRCVGNFREDPACATVFEGLVPTSGACYDEESRVFLVGIEACADGYCRRGDTCPGTCTAYTGRGETCSGSDCAPEDYCDFSDMRCRARKQSGEACDASGSCASGLLCLEGEEPTCVAPATSVDVACSDTRPCEGPSVCVEGECRWRVEINQPCALQIHCPEDTLCIPNASGQGRACLPLQSAGGPCNEPTHCSAGLVCDVAADASVGECVPNPNPPVGLDEPCEVAACAEDLWCSHEGAAGPICLAKGDAGAPCLQFGIPENSACHDGLYCTEEGTCAPPGNETEPCNVFESRSCADGLWCSRSTGLCTEPASEDELCNPLWGTSCDTGLSCACGDADASLCNSYTRAPNPNDRCKPKLAEGRTCWRASECLSEQCDLDFDAPTTPGQCRPESELCLP